VSTSSSINNPIGKPLRLGKPLQLTGTNHLLFRVGADVPLKALGGRVVDTSMTRSVGTVYDIFGPVENPFLSVKLQVSGEARTTDTDYLSASYFVLLEQRRPGGKNAHDARKFTRPTKFTKSAKPTKPKRG
jgi:rRNA processing protein Gar1